MTRAVCNILLCERVAEHDGSCAVHRHNAPPDYKPGICAIEDCRHPATAYGLYCVLHQGYPGFLGVQQSEPGPPPAQAPPPNTTSPPPGARPPRTAPPAKDAAPPAGSAALRRQLTGSSIEGADLTGNRLTLTLWKRGTGTYTLALTVIGAHLDIGRRT